MLNLSGKGRVMDEMNIHNRADEGFTLPEHSSAWICIWVPTILGRYKLLNQLFALVAFCSKSFHTFKMIINILTTYI